MKRILTLIAACSLTIGIRATRATYDIVPLPTHVTLTDTTRHFTLADGALIHFPAGNAEMERNAAFLVQYAREACGLNLVAQSHTSKAAIRLALTPTKQSTPSPDAYTLQVTRKGILLTASTPEGIFRGIQSLRKMLPLEPSATVEFTLATINDAPRFAYRGTHLDCARHFFSADFVKRFIDILALHGVNQFHWHLTDDQGWRFEVKALPQLAREASIRQCTVIGRNCGIYDDTEYGRGCYYTQEQLRDIVQYARERYINIIPEIDLPGHMVAALHVYPELGCTGGPYDVWPLWGVSDDVLCAGNPRTMEFLKTVLGELIDVFPSQYIHIGGDESPRVRWQHCAKCQAKMKELGLTHEAQLQTYINKELEKFLNAKGRTLIGWDETLEGGLSENAIVMSWRGYQGGIEAARLHHRVIMTPNEHCYFDHYQLRGETQTQPLAIGGYLPLSKVYGMEPVPSTLSDEEKQYIWGAQCNLWSEYIVGPEHVEYMLLPRLAALSEVQWMEPEAKNFETFKTRLARLEQLYQKLGYKFCRRYE